MNKQIELQKILQNNFEESKKKNPSYSLRAFSKRLGIHSSALSEILNGKRNVSQKMLGKLVQKLDLDPEASKKLFEAKNSENSAESLKKYLALNMDHYKLITEWYHFAIRQLIRTKDFKNDYSWIAGRLGITIKETDSVIERLLRLGLIEKKGKTFITNTQGYKTSDGVQNFNLQRAHRKTLEMAIESIEKNSMDERDFLSMTLAINPEKIKEAKQKTRKYLSEMNELLVQGEKSEVYELSICLFPLTQLKGESI